MTAPAPAVGQAVAVAEAGSTLLEHANALRSTLDDFATMPIAQLVKLFRKSAKGKDFPTVLKREVPQIVLPYAHAAAEVTAQWYEDLLPGSDFRAKPVVDIPADRIDKSVDWALYAPTSEPSGLIIHPDREDEPATWELDPDVTLGRVAGSAQRMVYDASRDTVISNAFEEGVRWVRVAQPDACGFCRLLATRQAVYHTEASALGVVGRTTRSLTQADRRAIAAGLMTRDEALARRGDYVKGENKGSAKVGALRGSRKYGESYHDHCRCGASPVRHGVYEPPDYAQQWEQDYTDAVTAAKRAGRTKGKYGAIDVKAVTREMDRIAAQRAKDEAAQVIEQKHRDDTAAWLDAEDEHRHAVDYWLRVDAEDLHSIPPAERAEPELPPVAESPMDRAARELEEAIESGDDARIGAAADALEQLEDSERKAAAKTAQAAQRKAQKANEQSDAIIGLIEQGWEPAEAESHITGRSVESIRRRDFMAQARAEGHTGAGFDDLIASVHDERVNEMYLAAENATNGYLVKRAYTLKVNPRTLWSVNDVTARKYMSEEMAAWFDENGRLTRPVLREMVLSGTYSIGKFTSQGQDYLR